MSCRSKFQSISLNFLLKFIGERKPQGNEEASDTGQLKSVESHEPLTHRNFGKLKILLESLLLSLFV